MATEENGKSRPTQFDRYADGMRLVSADDFEGAIVAFGEAIAMDPNSSFVSAVYRRRAEVYQRLGRVAGVELRAFPLQYLRYGAGPVHAHPLASTLTPA